MKGRRVIPQSVISVQSRSSAHGQGCWVLAGNNRSQPGWDGQHIFSSFHNNQKYRKRPSEENSAPYYLATFGGNHFAGTQNSNRRRKQTTFRVPIRHSSDVLQSSAGASRPSLVSEMTQRTKWDTRGGVLAPIYTACICVRSSRLCAENHFRFKGVVKKKKFCLNLSGPTCVCFFSPYEV